MGEIRNQKIVLVGGLEAFNNAHRSEHILREACWDLHSHIYNVKGREKIRILPTLRVMVNKSILGISADHIRAFQQILYEVDCSAPGIKKVIFGHSKGAEVIYEALKDDALAGFLTEKGLSEADILTRIRNIRAYIAVFTMGGTQKIPKRFAKVTRNFTFVDNRVAQIGEMLTEFNNEAVIEFNIEDGNNTTTESDCNSWCSGSQTASDFPSLSSSSGDSHHLSQYLSSQVMKDEIVRLLGV